MSYVIYIWHIKVRTMSLSLNLVSVEVDDPEIIRSTKVNPSDIQAPVVAGDYSDVFAYDITCLDIGESEFSFVVGNKASESNKWVETITRHECHQWSTRPDPQSLPVAITILAWTLFWEIFLKSEAGRRDNTCGNSDHYLPWLWVGLVDQLTWINNIKLCSI